MYVELVVLDMIDFNVILGMDWLCACFASIDCSIRVLKFHFPIAPVVGGSSIPRCCIISCLLDCKVISKGVSMLFYKN